MKNRMTKLETAVRKLQPKSRCTCTPEWVKAAIDTYDGLPFDPDGPTRDAACPFHGEGSEFHRCLLRAYGPSAEEATV